MTRRRPRSSAGEPIRCLRDDRRSDKTLGRKGGQVVSKPLRAPARSVAKILANGVSLDGIAPSSYRRMRAMGTAERHACCRDTARGAIVEGL